MSISRRNVLFALASSALVLLTSEVAARAYMAIDFGTPFGRPDEALYLFYPELRRVRDDSPTTADPGTDVLLLGGSVLDPEWGAVARILTERLTSAIGDDVAVHNLARPAQSTRDSYLKYKNLKDRFFDLVIVYHGINEVRANNCPPELFDSDYNHYAWYRYVNTLDRHPPSRLFALPTAARMAAVELSARYGRKIVPPGNPRPGWLRFGSEIKTGESFRENLQAILDTAESREEPVLLMTFASYFAPGYTLEKFRESRLDYTGHRSPIEIWGTPENVSRALETHNAVVRGITTTRAEVHFVDLESLMPKGRAYFDDVCHLTARGSERFVDLIEDEMLEALDAS